MEGKEFLLICNVSEAPPEIIRQFITQAKQIGLEVTEEGYGRLSFKGLIYPFKQCFICLNMRQCGFNAIAEGEKEVDCCLEYTAV